MIKILLIGDNHTWVDPAVLHHAKRADEIWHTGDWVNLELFLELEKMGKPIRSVWGNADGHEIRSIFPENNRFEIEGLKFWMTHIGGYPGKYNPKIRAQLTQNPPDVFICGHSHILRVNRDPNLNNMLCLNPGACGLQGFHQMRTALRFIIDQGKILNLEIIEMGLKTDVKPPYPWNQ